MTENFALHLTATTAHERVAEIIRAAVALAWDAGYQRGITDCEDDALYWSTNPYGTEST